MTSTFRDLIAANKWNSLLLVVIFLLFTFAVTMVLALAVLSMVNDRSSLKENLGLSAVVGGVAMAISLLFSIGSYFEGDKLVLMVNGAKPMEHSDDPQLYNVVEEM